MIDLHSHIIPLIDDGCSNVKQSIKLIRAAKKSGFTKIVCTPHYIEGLLPNDKETVYSRLESLKKVLEINNIDIELLCGTEVMINYDIVSLLKNDKICTINNSRYVLIEFPLDVKILNVDSVIKDIIGNGFIPIIAHPERYLYIIRDINIAKELVEEGAILQLNLTSLLGVYGTSSKATAIKLIKNDLISVIGSDSHIDRISYDIYGRALKKLKRYVSEFKYLQIVYENPRKICKDLEL